VIELRIVVEGQTESAFVDRVLQPHLWRWEIGTVPVVVKTRRDGARPASGGGNTYAFYEAELRRSFRDRRDHLRFSTMVDLYKLPGGFPGAEALPDIDRLETIWANAIAEPRFIPYVQVHEFEALLLADPLAIRKAFPGADRELETLQQEIRRFENPEQIDDGEQTAPSKRIITHIPAYKSNKVNAGPLIAEAIGLESLRAKCPHFGAWLTKLENLR